MRAALRDDARSGRTGRASMRGAALAFVAWLAAGTAHAQGTSAAAWPNRPVRLIVASAPGGITDIAARLVATRMAEAMGQPMPVENRAGAGGAIGVDVAARAAPDGYTLLMTTSGELAINPSLSKVPYDPTRDLAPIGLVSSNPLLLVVHPSVKATNVAELVALAKTTPMGYATPGNGSLNHLTGAWLNRQAATQLVHVPYKGGAPAAADVAGGQVPVGVVAISSGIGHIKGNKLRVVGITTATRSTVYPDWPTLQEQGIPDIDFAIWVGLLAPAGTPRDAIVRANAELNRALALPEVRERFATLGADVLGGTPERFAEVMRTDRERYARVVQTLGVKAE